ncbi:MAG TPA: HAD family hydrolase [Isosphaeraceae bacterium]|nr:HAD family hydrolase [Isosphaeraceae bacterium]
MPATVSPDDLTRRCSSIELLLVDVDGVLTNGVIAVDDRGVETKHFHVRDGSAIALWRKSGRKVAILSGRWAPLVNRRASELGIAPVIQGAGNKGEPFRKLLAELNLEPSQVCYMGDDLADLPVLLSAGLAACPSDAVPEVQDVAHVVASVPGGRGAVREVVEVILRQQGAWETLVEGFRQPA